MKEIANVRFITMNTYIVHIIQLINFCNIFW